MSVEMRLGKWMDRSGTVWFVELHVPGSAWPWRSFGGPAWRNDGTRYANSASNAADLIRYLGPLELSPTPVCADQAGTPVVSHVSTETAGEQLQRMRQRYNEMDREASIYSGLLAALDQAKSDLYERIRAMEKEHDL